MPSLEEIQSSMSEAIWGKKVDLSFIKANADIDAATRMNVHRTNVLEGLIKALQISYPGFWQLVGKDCARGASLAYMHQQENLTSRSNFNDFGHNFPEFIANFPSTKELVYLHDFAQMEWLRAKSYNAPRQKIIRTEEFQKALTDDLENYKIRFNDSVFFMQSVFPLMEIQELLNSSSSEKLSLRNVECFLIIARVKGKVETLQIPRADWKFLFLLANGKSIGSATKCLPEAEIDIKLTNLANLMLSKELVVEFYE